MLGMFLQDFNYELEGTLEKNCKVISVCSVDTLPASCV